MVLFDAYTLRARTAPAVAAALPAVGLIGGALVAPSGVPKAGGLLLGVILIVASQLARDAGRRIQPDLWARWGGSPTVQLLRHRSTNDPTRVQRHHTRLQAIRGERLPSAEEEAADPAWADARYDDAVADLRDLTRERERFPLVFAENVNYGFRRNMLGLRRWALAVAGAALVVAILLALFDDGTPGERLAAWGPSAAIALMAAVFWSRFVTPSWVRLAAAAYADRLLETTQTLRGNGATDRDKGA